MTSAVLSFDTLAYSKKLRAAGVPEQQAEIQAEALAEIIDEKLATKYDLEDLRMKLELKIAEQKSEIIKWIVGVSSAQAALIIGIKTIALR